MAYEGFQLVSYDYEDLESPDKTLPRATISGVIAVIAIYVLVALGSTMLVGAKTLVKQEEVALSIAGKEALGTTGLILVTIAAAFSTGSAINATLFSTGRLMEDVAEKRNLPQIFKKENKSSIPYYAILVMAAMAAALAVIGSLGTLVDAASLIFLVTFGAVNYIAYREKIKLRWLSLIGVFGCCIAIVLSSYQQFQENPIPISIIIGLIILSLVGRPFLLRKMNND